MPVAVAAGALAAAGGARSGALPQASNISTMHKTHHHRRKPAMTLLLLEALGAGLIFIGIVWWTMFAGRKGGEPPAADVNAASDSKKKNK